MTQEVDLDFEEICVFVWILFTCRILQVITLTPNLGVKDIRENNKHQQSGASIVHDCRDALVNKALRL